MSATDDSFRSFPGKSPDGKVPFACCPRDREPLIATFERRGAEFHCMVCGGWFGFLAPVRGDADELGARYDELKALFDAGQRGPLAEVA